MPHEMSENTEEFKLKKWREDQAKNIAKGRNTNHNFDTNTRIKNNQASYQDKFSFQREERTIWLKTIKKRELRFQIKFDEKARLLQEKIDKFAKESRAEVAKLKGAIMKERIKTEILKRKLRRVMEEMDTYCRKQHCQKDFIIANQSVQIDQLKRRGRETSQQMDDDDNQARRQSSDDDNQADKTATAFTNTAVETKRSLQRLSEKSNVDADVIVTTTEEICGKCEI